MRLARSRSSVPASAEPNVRKRWRPTWIATYEPTNSPACAPHASGIATAIRRLASITAMRTARTTIDSGSSSLVTQVV
jgi:hypothetical protein